MKTLWTFLVSASLINMFVSGVAISLQTRGGLYGGTGYVLYLLGNVTTGCTMWR